MTESINSDETKLSADSSPLSVDLAGTAPLPNTYTLDPHEGYSQRKVKSEDLPSRKLQFSQWHELRQTDIKGSQLKAPRVRKGPHDSDRDFYDLIDEDNNKIHHSLQGHQRKHHRDQTEDWENTKLASFTRQELHHGFQKNNIGRILERLKSVVYLNLNDNELLDLSSFNFPSCEYLNVDCNYLTSFKQLPSTPKVQLLTMQDNDLNNLDGISRLASTKLEELYLNGNPVSFHIGYRYLVFRALPNLKILDGVIKQPEDEQQPEGMEDKIKDRACVIC